VDTLAEICAWLKDVGAGRGIARSVSLPVCSETAPLVGEKITRNCDEEVRKVGASTLRLGIFEAKWRH
jgi:hypothetical protein